MDDDRSWLKNPILPRPPAVPRFSAAELRLVEDERLEDERPASVVRVAAGKERASRVRRRVSGASRARSLASESQAVQSRRIA
ncbi:MAG: hypothetical protein WDO74_22915 [Pseudomonadota bacterium]